MIQLINFGCFCIITNAYFILPHFLIGCPHVAIKLRSRSFVFQGQQIGGYGFIIFFEIHIGIPHIKMRATESLIYGNGKLIRINGFIKLFELIINNAHIVPCIFRIRICVYKPLIVGDAFLQSTHNL